MAMSLEEILALAPTQAEELTLSGWQPGSEITVRVKRPYLHNLLAKGALPNPLIPCVQRMFVHGYPQDDFAAPSADFSRALIAIAGEVLAEPTYAQLEGKGVTLTDDQLLELMLYATRGAEALAAFRRALRGGAGQHGQDLSAAAERDTAPAGRDCRVVPG